MKNIPRELAWAVGISAATFVLVPLLSTFPFSFHIEMPSARPGTVLMCALAGYLFLCVAIVKLAAVMSGENSFRLEE